MGELKITDLVDKGQIEELQKLEKKLSELRETYVDVAKELSKGIKMNIETPKDLDKLYELYNAQAARANRVTHDMNETLMMQKKVLQDVAVEIQKKMAQDNLSAKEMKGLSDATAKNAAAMEKLAKAEAAMTKAGKAAASSVKDANLSEEERNRIIKEAIELTSREVHSIQEANEVNKKLRRAVKLVRDTDEDYLNTLGKLNSTIGVNTDMVKRNSDRYTQQKMTIGDYKEQVKAAIVELQNGNRSMKNFGIVAKGFGGILKTSVSSGLSEVRMGVGNMIKGFVGAQAVLTGLQKLTQLLKSGWQSIVSFEAETSKLAAILGTTSKGIKELTDDARKLGAETKYTASQAAALQIELAKLGFTKKEILDATEYVLKFAQATGSELSEAAALAGASLRMFGADTEETERYVSAMAVATTKSALSFSYLQTAMPIVGPVAKAFNFTIEDTLSLLGKLSDSGFDASMAATALRNIFLNLADSNGKLAKALGGPVKNLPELVAGMKKLRDMGVDLNTTLELTDKRSVAQFNTLMQNIDSILPLRENITGVEKELSNMADTMSNNVQGAIAGLSSAWEALMLSFRRSTGPAKEVIDFLAKGIRNVAQSIEYNNMTLEEQEDYLIQKAIQNQSELYNQSKGNQVLLANLRDSWNEYKNEGLDGEAAFKKASEEHLNQLEKEKKKYEKIRDEEKMRYKSHTELYFSASKLDKILNPDKFKQMHKERESYFGGWKTAEVELSKIETKIDKINKTTYEDISGEVQRKATELTAEELKKRQKLLEAMKQSELDLMDEGLEKELAKISLAYNKKIAAITGNSKEEQKTRENLAKKMQMDLENTTIDYGLKKEKESIQNKLAVVKSGSEEEYELRLKLLDNEREIAINEAIRKGGDVVAIDAIYENKRTKLKSDQAERRNKIAQDEHAASVVIVNSLMGKELDLLTEQYKKGEIKKEEYEKRKAEIQKKYQIQQLQMALDLAKLMSAMPGLSDEDRLKLKQAVAEAEIKLSNQVRDNEIENLEEQKEKRKEYMSGVKEGLSSITDITRDAVGETADIFSGLNTVIMDIAENGKLSFESLATALIDVFNGINAIVQNSFQARIDKLDEEKKANEEARDEEIEKYEEMVERGVISEEEAEARKRAAEDKTAAKNKELEKKKSDLKRKQAIWDKATNIAQAGMATALAVTKALPNLVLAAIVGAMGAVQIATIAATPIPAYAEGTKNGKHPGGKAIVGDGGKRELVTYNGQAWITPDKPVMVDLPKGAEVFPDVGNIDKPDWTPSGMSFIPNKEGGIFVMNDYSRLESKLEEINLVLIKTLRSQKKFNSDREFNLYKLSKI